MFMPQTAQSFILFPTQVLFKWFMPRMVNSMFVVLLLLSLISGWEFSGVIGIGSIIIVPYTKQGSVDLNMFVILSAAQTAMSL
jgi:hypothetical protein